MHYVFVYGTLKEGFPNYQFNKGKRVKGTFVTKDRYPFYLVGNRFAPWLILDRGKGYHIKGQVFHVDETTLKDMDILELISEQDGYRKVEIPVVSIDNNKEILVFMYGKPVEQLNSADLRSDSLNEYRIEHAAMYITRNS